MEHDLFELDIGVYSRPCFGERVNGDWAYVTKEGEWYFIAIIDGIGHGRNANLIARSAKDILTKHWSVDLSQTIKILDEKLSTTDGAAGAVAVLNIKTGVLNYMGVGNTIFLKNGTTPERLYSIEGMLGNRSRKPKQQNLMIKKKDILFFCTDGISYNKKLKELNNYFM